MTDFWFEITWVCGLSFCVIGTQFSCLACRRESRVEWGAVEEDAPPLQSDTADAQTWEPQTLALPARR
jgi:hypothetical protein